VIRLKNCTMFETLKFHNPAVPSLPSINPSRSRAGLGCAEKARGVGGRANIVLVYCSNRSD
jgi:hypothetical protein